MNSNWKGQSTELPSTSAANQSAGSPIQSSQLIEHVSVQSPDTAETPSNYTFQVIQSNQTFEPIEHISIPSPGSVVNPMQYGFQIIQPNEVVSPQQVAGEMNEEYLIQDANSVQGKCHT